MPNTESDLMLDNACPYVKHRAQEELLLKFLGVNFRVRAACPGPFEGVIS